MILDAQSQETFIPDFSVTMGTQYDINKCFDACVAGILADFRILWQHKHLCYLLLYCSA